MILEIDLPNVLTIVYIIVGVLIVISLIVVIRILVNINKIVNKAKETTEAINQFIITPINLGKKFYGNIENYIKKHKKEDTDDL